jgi:hypothetical protein
MQEARLKQKEIDSKAQDLHQTYISGFLTTALNQDIEPRLRFSEYFSFVSEKESRDQWEKYHNDLQPRRDAVRQAIIDMEQKAALLSAKETPGIEEQIELLRLKRELEWKYGEVRYARQDSNITIPNSASDHLDESRPVFYSQEIVDRIRQHPGVTYPSGVLVQKKSADHTVLGIILHTADSPDSSAGILRFGRADLPGPLAHWAVLSGGSIELIADETQRANHSGVATPPLVNSNTIGITATGVPAFSDDRQVESLVRLVADAADRWDIPTNMILSHAEAALPKGRTTGMLQQAPAIRQMVDAVRKKR